MSYHIVRVGGEDYTVFTERLGGNWFASGEYEGGHRRGAASTEQKALKRWKEGAGFLSIPRDVWIAGALAGAAVYVKFRDLPHIYFVVLCLMLCAYIVVSIIRDKANFKR